MGIICNTFTASIQPFCSFVESCLHSFRTLGFLHEGLGWEAETEKTSELRNSRRVRTNDRWAVIWRVGGDLERGSAAGPGHVAARFYTLRGGTESSIGEGDKRILGKEMCDQLPCIDPSPDSSQGPYAEFIGIAVE